MALVEAQDLSKLRAWKLPPDRYSNRCSSLTPASASFLDRIGAWKHIDRDRVQPYHEMQVWDGVSGARIEFDSPPTHGGTIAYMIENLNLISGLLKRLDELGGVAMYDSSRVEHITYGEETEEVDLRQWPVVHLSSGAQLAARLLVGADGANSPVRTFAGIQARGWDYDRHGVVATLQLSESTPNTFKTAYQRFLPTGPVALLPLPGPYASLVWSTTPKNAAHLKSLSSEDFVAMVNAAFRLSPVDLAYLHTIPSNHVDELTWRSQHTPFPSPPTIPYPVTAVQPQTVASFPLRLRHADSYTAHRIALLGDAAHTVHPLAGQGLNQGQGDVQALAGTVAEAVQHGMDLGVIGALQDYNGKRWVENHVLMGVCDKLHKIYGTGWGPVVAVRSVGVEVVNKLGPVKRWLMERVGEGRLF